MEIVQKELKLLWNSALLGDIEFARILFNEIATNKTIISDINKDNLLYFDKTIITLFIILYNCLFIRLRLN